METPANWIYYLKLQKELGPEFLILDRKFKENNKSLVPIGIGNINEIKPPEPRPQAYWP